MVSLCLLLAIHPLHAGDDGVLIGPRGSVQSAAVLDGDGPSQAAPPPVAPSLDGAVVIRMGGQRMSAEQLGHAALPVSDATPISLDLQGADIHNVLRFFAEVSDINIVAADGVSGRVTVRLEDVPWDQALAAVLGSLGLAATVHGERILLVSPPGGAP